MGDDDNHRDDSGTFTRRNWLRFAGGAGVAGLAGCGGDGDGDGNATTTDDGNGTTTDGDGTTTDGTTTASEPSIADGVLQVPWLRASTDLPNAELNRWGANFVGQVARKVCVFPGAKSTVHNLEWVPLDLVSWEHDAENGEVRAKYRDDIYWTSGTEQVAPFTAEDAKVMYQLLRYMDPPEARSENPTVQDWRVASDDEQTLVLELNPDGYNLASVLSTIQAQYITTYRDSFFGDKIEALLDASTADEEQPHREDVASHQVNFSDDPYICGPYMLENVNQQTAQFTINPNHWAALEGERVPRRFELKVLGGGANADYQAVSTGDLSITSSAIPTSVQTSAVPDRVQQVAMPANFGTTLILNYGHGIDPYLGVDGQLPPEERVAGAQQAKVRQGIAHAINFEHVMQNHLGSRLADQVSPYERGHPSLPSTVQNAFPDFYEQLPQYAEQDAEMATQRFEEAGLTREGGTWRKPDGNALSLTLQSRSQVTSMISTITEHLQDFGIDAQHQPSGEQLNTQYLEGSFSVARGWVESFPLGVEARDKLVPNAGWPPIVKPGVYEVPPEGDMDAEPNEAVNVDELSAGFNTSSLEEHNDAARKMVWVYAYHLPDIPLFSEMTAYTLNTQQMNWPQPAPEGKVTSPTSDHALAYGGGFELLSHAYPGVSAPEN